MPKSAFFYDDAFLAYKFSDNHPLRQERLQIFDRLIDSYGLYESGDVLRVTPSLASRPDLERVHSAEYLDCIARLSRGEHHASDSRHGFGSSDNPPFPGMWEASCLYAGASQMAAEMVLSGAVKNAFNPSGGLHHAFHSRASGFCILNDNALAAQVALAKGMRVAYIDIDAHHGDGTQSLFYSNPDVLTLSIHETGQSLFPGTGFPSETGEGDGEGTSINIPMAPYSTDHHYEFAFEQAIKPIVTSYDPDFLILQVGADAHWQDPLAHLELTSQGWMSLFRQVMGLAGDKPFIVLGGGGYTVSTVARLWTMVQAELIGQSLADDVPVDAATAFTITHLHDKEGPSTTEKEYEGAWQYVRSSVDALKSLVGTRYGM